jgi:hypothetical protein
MRYTYMREERDVIPFVELFRVEVVDGLGRSDGDGDFVHAEHARIGHEVDGAELLCCLSTQ